MACTLSGWTYWSACNSTGFRERTREITSQALRGGECAAELKQIQNCAIDCVMGEWGDWGLCSTTCEEGVQSRTRSPSTHAQYGGLACTETPLEETQSCNQGECAHEPCAVTDWGDWGGCSASCGGGVQTRARMWYDTEYATDPDHAREHDVTECLQHPQDTPLTDTQSCSTHQCPVDCQTSPWSAWSTCSHTCGGGTQNRLRMQSVMAKYGGMPCGAFAESQQCGTQVCPTDCEVTSWGEWESAPGSMLRRTRTVVTDVADGGVDCPELDQERPFSDLCEDEVSYGPWSECSKECDTGYKFRYREHRICSTQASLKYQMNFRQSKRCNTHQCPSEIEQAMLSGAVL